MNSQQPFEPTEITKQFWNANDSPIVSVFSWVYNQKDFIKESIESILMQRTTFPVEIIIHDDASNDGSAEIIKEYEAKYPHLFKNILHQENQWSQGKSVMTPLFNKPRGKYIALTHGDDYWVDPNQLQKQVDFLENNEEYVLCYHDVKGISESGETIYESKIKALGDDIKGDLTSEELMLGRVLIPTLSVCFRNENYNYPKSSIEVKNGDVYLFAFLGKFGKGMFLDNIISGVYRIHDGGVYSKQNNLKKTIDGINTRLRILEDIITDPSCKKKMEKNISNIEKQFATICIRNLHLKDYFIFIKQLKYNNPLSLTISTLLSLTKSFLKKLFY